MNRRGQLSAGAWQGGIAGLLFLIALSFRGPLERSMTAHMLVHIPLLVLSGVLLGHAGLHAVSHLPDGHLRRWLTALRGFDAHGAPGLLFASLAGMYWMIPKALDDVLLSPWVALGKFVSLMLAGMWLAAAWRRAHRVIRLFFVGGFCWTSAIVGMLYQESSARLCNFYLLDDQTWAGRGLVILAILLPLTWLVAEMRGQRRRHTLRSERPVRSGAARSHVQESS